MGRKIVITGPESSGKTTLAKALANHYNTCFTQEYAREYLAQLTTPYTLQDVLIMAEEQLKKEKEADDELIFLDTDLSVFSIWIQEKYQQKIEWIDEQLKLPTNKIYFLCDIDIPWEADKLREHPELKDRKRLFNDYIKLLEKYKLQYHIISGDISHRIKKCSEIINQSI